MKRKKVLVFGTFDGLHLGHLSLFRQAKKYGDYLIVVVSRDATVKKVKGHKPQFSEQERLKKVYAQKMVDDAQLGNLKNYYKKIKEIKPNVICLGYDQQAFTENLEKEIAKMNSKNPLAGSGRVEIIRLKPHKSEKYKSSLLNKKLA